jgi:ankyrin repeat protein
VSERERDTIGAALFDGRLEDARKLIAPDELLDFDVAAGLGLLDRLKVVEEDHSERWSGFLLACKNGQLDVVKYLVPRGIDLTIYPPGSDWGGIGASGLHWAATHGHPELVRWLVAAGTPVDIVDDVYENTPLGWVLLDGDDAMAKILLELGADRSRARE